MVMFFTRSSGVNIILGVNQTCQSFILLGVWSRGSVVQHEFKWGSKNWI
jgi:hypothetical protein